MQQFRRDLWAEGRYVDLWSTVHFMTGFSTALIGVLVEAPLIPMFCIFTVLGVLWEVFESYVGIHEHIMNRVVDVLVNSAGFLGVVFGVKHLFLNGFQYAVLTACSILFLGLLTFAGWYAFRRRTHETKP